jgi:uncharacterized glyoxalase superfamily protein PhnB
MSITPYLLYEDVPAALDWLAQAFGLRETLRYAGDDGVVSHAEMQLGDAVVMLGHPGPEYRNPKHLGHRTQLLVVDVEDADAHHRRAAEAGATIVEEPGDKPYGVRAYRAEDPEGHQWSFQQAIAEVAPADWGAVSASG